MVAFEASKSNIVVYRKMKANGWSMHDNVT